MMVYPSHLWRRRLVYGGGDSSMERKIPLWRGRLFYGGEDSFLLRWWKKTVESC
jgi:hypothetical protein